MARPFDATLKGMLEGSPADWLPVCGHRRDVVELIDADVSTYTGAADKVLRVGRKKPWILHLDFQSGHDPTLPARLHLYNALLGNRHQLRVRSVAVFLAPGAWRASQGGEHRCGFAGEEPYVVFRYQVIKVWELEAERLLEGGLGTLPLAPIGAVSQDEVPGVIRRMGRRLRGDVEAARAQELWSATFVLMGLRYEEGFIEDALKGVTDMEESVTYRAIVEKGRKEGLLEEARKMVLRLGEKRIGAPSARVQTALEGLELPKLEELLLRVNEVSSWEELLGMPARGRGRKR